MMLVWHIKGWKHNTEIPVGWDGHQRSRRFDTTVHVKEVLGGSANVVMRTICEKGVGTTVRQGPDLLYKFTQNRDVVQGGSAQRERFATMSKAMVEESAEGAPGGQAIGTPSRVSTKNRLEADLLREDECRTEALGLQQQATGFLLRNLV